MIDYKILAEALDYYTERGFSRVETPWTVTPAVSEITKPLGAPDWVLEGRNKVLVASGEQSFLYQYLKGFLPKGRFITVTPCFRDEPFDLLHTKYFIKAELIDTDFVNSIGLESMIQIAYEFFRSKLGESDLSIVRTQEGADIEWHGKELGSYGIRSCPYLQWIYGTAVAEPRLSALRNHYGVS